ncbi:NAD(P)H-dependent oxidoreductase [Streptomyces sp. NPDC005811]|uniref:FMN-dependent NADH-azoreductase n=1 Tax=Streptomyces sp. NPDC005811 TaxID=3154565 RepID=UPI0034024BCC
MATLLHIDSSVLPVSASASRSLAELFRATWLEQHPEGTVVHRDLAVHPVSHLTAAAHHAGYLDPARHDGEQAAAFAERKELIEELEAADAVLIGAPMYNLSVPSTLKAWIDNVVLIGRTALGAATLQGKHVTVVTSRGGAYGPGTPREGYDYVQNYLEGVFGMMLGMEIEFIVPELTGAPVDPAMAELLPLYEASRSRTREEATALAERLAARLGEAA